MEKSEDQQLWVMKDQAGVYKIGLTAEAQDEFGEITFVTLPKVGTKLEKGASLADVEAEKAVSELVSPISGEVVSVNTAAEADPTLLNQTDLGKNWLVQIKKD